MRDDAHLFLGAMLQHPQKIHHFLSTLKRKVCVFILGHFIENFVTP